MKKLRVVLCTILATILTVSPVEAKLDSATLDFFAQNNILFYDPTGSRGCVSNTAPSGKNITWIGDSISVGAKSYIESRFTGIDVEDKVFNGNTYQMLQVSKVFGEGDSSNFGGTAIAEVLAREGELKNYLVFALGTNSAGGVSDAAIQKLMSTVGESKNVVFVTNYAMDGKLDFSSNNAAIQRAATTYPNVAVADWATDVAKDPSAYIGDGYVHPNEAGNKLFVDLIYKAISTLTGSTTASLTGTNTNYAGAQVWSDAEIQMVEANRPFYEAAAQKYGFPWQVLAVVHSQEFSLRRENPANGQGAYQLYSYTAGGTNANAFLPAGPISDAEFQRQTDLAAGIIAEYGLDLNSDGGVKRLFFQYNGTSQKYIDKAIAMGFSEREAQNGEGSAYVMNRYDAQRDPTSGGMSPLWPGRYVADGVYDEGSTTTGFGTFVKYIAIGGMDGMGYCYAASNDITEVALALSWDGLNSHSKDDPKAEYITAMQEVGNYVTPCNDSGCAPKGASCDIFVSTVMRYSGADTEFPQYGPGQQRDYMLSHPDMYEEVIHNGDFSTLMSGDVFVTDGHVFLYVEIDGEPGQASASFNDRTGEHFKSIYFEDHYGDGGSTRSYRVFRRINR